MRETVDHRERVPTRLARQPVHGFASCDVPGLFDAVRDGDGTMPVIEHPEQITAPVLLIWGARDTLATRDQMDRYLVALPDVTFLELTNAGDCLQVEEPERTAEEILAFTA